MSYAGCLKVTIASIALAKKKVLDNIAMEASAKQQNSKNRTNYRPALNAALNLVRIARIRGLALKFIYRLSEPLLCSFGQTFKSL